MKEHRGALMGGSLINRLLFCTPQGTTPPMFARRSLATIVCAFCVAFSVGAAAQSAEPVAVNAAPAASAAQVDTLPPSSARTRLLLVGAGITAGFYGLGLGTSYMWEDSPAAKSLRLPIAGAWMALPKSGCGESEAHCDTFPVVARTGFSALSAIGQAGGMLLLFEALFMSTDSGATASNSDSSWYAVPLASAENWGLVLGGDF